MAERDPNGLQANQPGAKLDAGKPRLGLVLMGFSNALRLVGEVGTYGADKYTDGGWLQVQKGAERYTDAMFRHLLSEASTAELEANDAESGLPHAAHAAWNALARLELMIQNGEFQEFL